VKVTALKAAAREEDEESDEEAGAASKHRKLGWGGNYVEISMLLPIPFFSEMGFITIR
jgi:hypothetical protein